MPTHKAVHVASAGAEFTLADVETPSPARDHVRINVAACGVCGTDQGVVHGGFPDMTWPVTPGHEAAGTIAELGEGVEDFAVGDRVAVGWFGGNCNKCVPCRKGKFMQCVNFEVPSLAYPGGYAESIVAPTTALARVPDALSFAEAAPMGCAGVTTFNALRRTEAVAGDLVAVLGIGGLGHLGVQWARAMGFETVAIARGANKAEDAKKLGAHHYIDSTAEDVAAALQDLGGATVVLATAANSAAIGQTVGGLGPEGELVVVGVTADPHADQPAGPDPGRTPRQRASVGHVTRRGGDDALRRAVGGARVDRGTAAGPSLGGLYRDAGGACAVPRGLDHVRSRGS